MKNSLLFCCFAILAACGPGKFNRVLIDDDFSGYPVGLFTPDVGPELEYHFIAEKFPEGNWRQAAFADRRMDTAYRVVPYGQGVAMFQDETPSPRKTGYTHPIMIAGEKHWSDYRVECEVTPVNTLDQAGIVFRYQNSRQYYFFGMEKDNRAVLYRVDHERAFHDPVEDALASQEFAWEPGRTYTLTADVTGDRFRLGIDGTQLFDVRDGLYAKGKIGFFSDIPAYFTRVRVATSGAELKRIAAESKAEADEEAALQAANPKPTLWKQIDTKGFGTTRNIRFGDIDGDGRTDILLGQVIQHGYPRVDLCEIRCLTALTADGERIWQIGEPSDDPHAAHISNDTAFQIADIDNDGKNELVYVFNRELIIADAATGRTLRKIPTPANPGRRNSFGQILGDCIHICNVSGRQTPQDILLKDRYEQVWVYDNSLKLLWTAKCTTGHYPYACDVDGDGRDEVMVGYTMFAPDGRVLWTWDDGRVTDHCDGVAVVNARKDDPKWGLKVYNAASDEGFIIADTKGNIEKHYYIGHVQNPVMANFRDDMPGLEIATVNFWGNQGIIHLFDSEGNIYHSFEPLNAGSMMLPVNWTGGAEEFFVYNAHPRFGGMYDGWGRKAVAFPDDGHPYLCNAVVDLTGDVRDELVVWDPERLWIYTQDDSPRDNAGLLKPVRNPLYNYSNYQMTVSQ